MADPLEDPPPRHPAWRVARQFAGWFFIVLAVVGLLIPVFPHTPFLALGAILLAPYVRIFRRLSAWVHKRYPGTRPHLRRFRMFKRPLRKVPPAP